MKYSMKNKWVHTKLGASFIGHIERFMLKMDLFPKSGRGHVAVSAGSDSMALLYLLNNIFKKKGLTLEVLHVNHGTRPENLTEEALIKKFCEAENLTLHIKRLEIDLSTSNFEKLARDKRKNFFLDSCKEGDVVYTGHHIDDSFEWSLMQKLKTSSKISSLGIPVWNQPFARPFMAVTKSQIGRLIKKENLSFLEDSSNLNERYERNYLRKNIIPAIAKKYPHYLKHYVARSNELAGEWKISRSPFTGNSHIKKRDQFGGIFLINSKFENNFQGKEQEILDCIKTLSKKNRGILNSQVQKLIVASSNGQKGPLSFSGGVKGFLFQGCLYFASDEVLEKWKDYDLLMVNNLKLNSWIPVNTRSLVNSKIFKSPMIFFLKNDLELKSMKKPHPLLKESTSWALDNGICFQELSRAQYLKFKND